MVRNIDSIDGRDNSLGRIVRCVILFGTPLALVGIELSHPAHVGHDVAGTFFPIADWWFILHIIQFALFGLMGIAIVLLTADCRGIAAMVSRFGAAGFVIFYDLGDAVIGVAAGVLGRHVSDLTPAIRAGRVEAIGTIFNDPIINGIYTVGRAAWFVALLSAAVAIYRRYRVPLPGGLFALSGVILLVFDHPGLPGSIGFASFFAGAVTLSQVRRTGTSPPTVSNGPIV